MEFEPATECEVCGKVIYVLDDEYQNRTLTMDGISLYPCAICDDCIKSGTYDTWRKGFDTAYFLLTSKKPLTGKG